MEGYGFLEDLGFSQNEAKVYITLLQHGAQNGYEIAKNSGVARSLVYGVVDRLVKKGAATEVKGNPALYKAVGYRQLIDREQKAFAQKIELAQARLEQYAAQRQEDAYVRNVDGYEKLCALAAALIANAEEELYLSLWKQELADLEGALRAAAARGVQLYIFSFDDIVLDCATVFSYRLADPENLFPQRRLVVVADRREVVIGENGAGSENVGLHTKNSTLVNLAIDELVLDILCFQVMKGKNGGGAISTAQEFMARLKALGREYGIGTDMPKNLAVWNYQNMGSEL